ncbi:hypothetical protein LG200_09005 [Methylobacillus caricis]|uniref:DUF6607 family protein n=1 Tax=Methylobacillus caricis TaxID=1971611 RepID=UPI001CFFF7B5|nr:DUF6607 family protein [Methylobacillus caricis]MCB5188139.1 hypothetical protein [Methylobacillus caricis]
MISRLVLVLTLLCQLPSAYADAQPTNERQYTFSWQFQDESSLSPRGGTTTGTSVKLVTEPSAEWKALQEPGLSSFERDRRAILAMAGEYRATFDFIETAGFVTAYKPNRPYRSWGTEKVYLVEDKGTSIVLQHLLVMSFVGENGKVEGPFVTKHWRQDWQYEAPEQLVFRGNNTWQRVKVPADRQSGFWRQTVYQVDDSPRYSGVAKWQHLGNYSSWSDEDGWRPLPRREYSIRGDYDVLIGNNRHIITPTGWVHEQQNLKVKLDKTGEIAASNPALARESGFNRYERIQDFDWSEGDRYIQASKPVWDAVRDKWQRLIASNEFLRLRGSPDKDNLFIPLYQYAQEVAESKTPVPAAEISKKVDAAVQDYLARDGKNR